MTIEEILAGESKNVEFKENLPEKSIKYMKSVVASRGLGDVYKRQVSEGRQRPYYIKALGRESGVYVRVAGTTRLADAYMVKELLF